MSVIQKKVSHYLKEKGWSIVTASEKSGIPVVTIKSIIYGKSTNQRLTTLEKMAKAFDCSVNDLITEDVEASKVNSEKLDLILFRECLDAVESYLEKHQISCSKQKTMKVVDSLFSLMVKKKQSNTQYLIDDDIIGWIVDNESLS